MKAVSVVSSVTVVDQRLAAGGGGGGGVKKELAGTFKASSTSLACPQFMTLEELRSPERGFMAQGRALLRCDIKIAEVEAV